ncbi:hypothetical protein [Streptomyces hebeiensis]
MSWFSRAGPGVENMTRSGRLAQVEHGLGPGAGRVVGDGELGCGQV